jgi:lipopolysaccharide transport system ATP-binding protein
MLCNVTKSQPASAIESEVLLTLQHVSKSYRIWRHPLERVVYGLWNQVPAHAPQAVREFAASHKAKLGREVFALNQVSLSVRSGRSVGVIGRNGSGKSTLLQLIAGVLQPTTGKVCANTKRIAALLELGSGFDPNFTGRENVLLHGALSGLTQKENKARLNEVVEFSEIGDYFDRPLKTYSSGMGLRLAFASSITVRPELLIVDEALAVGDVFFQQKCFNKIRELVKQGVTILIVSHDLRSVEEFCEETILLHKGNVAFFGNSTQAISAYYGLERSLSIVGSSGDDLLIKDRTDQTTSSVALTPIAPEQTTPGAAARFTRYAVLNDKGNPTGLFKQGEWMTVIFDIAVGADIENLSSGVVLRDDRGVFQFCKHQFQIDFFTVRNVQSGERIRSEIAVRLDLAAGTYTLSLDMITIPAKAIQGGKLSFPDFNQWHRRVCSASNLLALTVSMDRDRPGSEFTHFGLFDLPSRFQVMR